MWSDLVFKKHNSGTLCQTQYQNKDWGKGTHVNFMHRTQVRHDKVLSQSGRIQRAALAEFVDGLKVGRERKRKVKNDSKVFAWYKSKDGVVFIIEIRKIWEGTDLWKCIMEDYKFHFRHGKLEMYISHLMEIFQRVTWILESGAQRRDQEGRYKFWRHWCKPWDWPLGDI